MNIFYGQAWTLSLMNLLGHGENMQFSVFLSSPVHGLPPFIGGWITWRVKVFVAFTPQVELQGLSIHGPSLQWTVNQN